MTVDHDAPPLLEGPPPDDWHTPAPPDGDITDPAHALEFDLLAIALAHPQTIQEISDAGVTGATFTSPGHELIWNAARTLDAGDYPVTSVSVFDELDRRQQLRDRAFRALTAPLPLYLAKLYSHGSGMTSVTAGWYAERARERQQLRDDRTTLTRALQVAENGADDAHDGVLTILREHLDDARARDIAPPSTWQPVDVMTIDLSDVLEPNLLEREDGVRLLYAGAVHAVVGEPETGKSWLGMIGCAQEVKAERPVAYLDFEDQAGPVIQRMIQLGCSRRQLAEHFRYINPDVALTSGEVRHLVDAVTGTTLVIVDGVTEAMTLHGLSLQDNEDIARFLALLPKRIANLGPAVLQVDHVVKDTDARGRYAIGGQHKLAGIYAQYKSIVTEPFARGKRGHAKIIVDKDRPGGVRQNAFGLTIAELVIDSTPLPEVPDEPVGPLRVYLNSPDTSAVGDHGEFRPTNLMTKVSDYLLLVPGASSKDIEDNVPGKAVTVRAAVRQLIAEGNIRRESAGRGAHRHFVDAPFEGLS